MRLAPADWSTSHAANHNAVSTDTNVSSRNATNNILEKVEVEQSKWQSDVEEQHRKVLTDHTALN